MGATVKELKTIYVALGGDADDVANMVTIPEVLGAIGTILEGKTLPAVESTDNGKVLAVNADGEWEATTLPS